VKRITGRIVEAYVGEYASGKSEVAVNRALELRGAGKEVTLVDLDTVEPFYTLRPLKKVLEEQGVYVIAWSTAETMGLGEAGSILKGEARWALKRTGDIILDVGYGAQGADTLNLIEGSKSDPHLKVLAVINLMRPLTSTVEEVVEYVHELKRIDGLINNTHLGEETTPEIVQEGARLVHEAAKILNLPVIATTALKEIYKQIGGVDACGTPVRLIKRYMPGALW